MYVIVLAIEASQLITLTARKPQLLLRERLDEVHIRFPAAQDSKDRRSGKCSSALTMDVR